MRQIERAETNKIGVKISGSAEGGQRITLENETALDMVFGTSDSDQANALLSHCLKTLKFSHIITAI